MKINYLDKNIIIILKKAFKNHQILRGHFLPLHPFLKKTF